MDENPYRPGQTEDRVSPSPKKSWTTTVLTVVFVLGIGLLLVAMMLPAVRTAGPLARRNTCQNRLKQIAIALQNYADEHGVFPPAYTTDDDGKPLHSWRTLLLPYLEQNALYESIDLTKPWDDPANAEARETSVDEYCCPSVLDSGNRTTYLAVVTPGSCLQPGKGREISEITDGTNETLTVIEVAPQDAVPWMAPRDADEQLVLSIATQSELVHTDGVHAAMANCSVFFLRADLPGAQRRALISIAGGDKVTPADMD